MQQSDSATKTINDTSVTHRIKSGILAGLPIMFGYLPVAITYGVLAKQAGLTVFELTTMSVLVFAGAAQFMSIGMIAAGVGIAEIVLATFVLNFRHFVMNLSFMHQVRFIPTRWKIALSATLTDETFAVGTFNKEQASQKKGYVFYLAMFLTAYLTWVVGSFLGGVLGEIIPERLSQSMGIALYALFIGLLMPSIKKEAKIGIIAIIAMLIHLICSYLGMSTGWAIVTSTILGGMAGIVLFKEDKPS